MTKKAALNYLNGTPSLKLRNTKHAGAVSSSMGYVDAQSIRGRGIASNAVGRFEAQSRTDFDDGWNDQGEVVDEISSPSLQTFVQNEVAKSILTKNQSPDIPFDRSVNPYRGCEHGCFYCFARPSHAYIGLSPGLDFESHLFAKPNAAELLRKALSRKGYQVAPIAIGTNTDPYQPIERERKITREILELLHECRHPVTVLTKSSLVLRDLDILSEMAKLNLAKVGLSVTSLDHRLSRAMEPRASTPKRRLDAIKQLSNAGVPVGVMVAPIIPAVNDHEIEAILDAAQDMGATEAAYILVRLPLELKTLFAEWLETHMPDRKDRVMSRLMAMKDGKLNDPRFGYRFKGQGAEAEMMRQRFYLAANKAGLADHRRERVRLDCTKFRAPNANGQMNLF